MGDDRTNVRVYIQPEADPYMCAENVNEPGRVPPYPDAFLQIPALETPDSMSFTGQSGGGGGGGGPLGRGPVSAYQSVILEGEMPLADLADYYSVQLEDEGWEAVDAISESGIAWSSWTFAVEDAGTWSGTLIITADPLAENRYQALIQVNSGPDA
jgi:hypothetical protein